MKVAIVGGGAVGLLIAAYLCEANVNPIIYTRREEQADDLNKNGLLMNKNGMEFKYKVTAYPFSLGIKNDVDLILVTVKQYDLESIISYLTEEKVDAPILFLQNGMAHLSYLPTLFSQSIYLGIIEHGVIKLSDCRVSHTGIGQIKIGKYKGNLLGIENVCEALNSVGFFIKIEQEWYPILVKKLVVNAVINPLTTLYKVKNGCLLENKFYFTNMKTVFNEIMAVVNVNNVEELWEDVVSICRKTGDNYSSMYKDIENHRQTEIQSILGYLMAEGEKRKITMPLSSFVYCSIKGMEDMGKEEENG